MSSVRAGAFMKRHMKETSRTAKNRWKPQIAIGFSDDFFSSKKPTTMLVFQWEKIRLFISKNRKYDASWESRKEWSSRIITRHLRTTTYHVTFTAYTSCYLEPEIEYVLIGVQAKLILKIFVSGEIKRFTARERRVGLIRPRMDLGWQNK